MAEDEPRTGRPIPVGIKNLERLPGSADGSDQDGLENVTGAYDSDMIKEGSVATEKEEQLPDVIPPSAAQNAAKLPPPNKDGAIGTFPLEDLDQKRFRRAPDRDKNKLDTSIDTATYNAERQTIANIEKAVSKDDPEHLFPWYQVGGFEVNKTTGRQLKNSRIVKSYVVENYYNDWYYNTSAVIGTCFFSWLLAHLNFSWWSLGFVFFCTASVYRAEFRRFTRNIRDDMKRVTVKETLSDMTESSLWLNSFLSKFWTIYMPVLSQQVSDAVNPQLAGAAPGYGIDALSLNEFTLGTKAPSIDAIKSYTKKGDDVVEMDWTFSFMPNDESNMTPKEAKHKINPKIALGVTVGKGFVSKSLPVLVEDINVAGTAHIVIKFGNVFPNIKVVSVSMIEPPFIDFALKPVGGDTLGLDIMSFLPGLKTFVKLLINSNVGPMLYSPNKLDIDVEEIMAAQSQDAIGVVAITIDSASDLKTNDFLSTTVDPYITFKAEKGIIGHEADLQTTIKSDTKNPRWNETKYILVNSLEQKLTLTCLDSNEVRKDVEIGALDIDLSELYQKPSQEHLSKDLMARGKSHGVLNYSINWFPVIEETTDSSDANSTKSGSPEDDTEEDTLVDAVEADVGILKLTLHKVKYLNKSSAMTGSLSPCAELYIDGKLVKEYRTLRRINEPSWEESLEVLVPSKSKSEIAFKVYDTQLHGNKLIAEYTAPMEDVVEALEQGRTFVNASPQGEIYISSSWKPVSMTGAFEVHHSIREPLGALRVHLKDAMLADADLSGIGDIDPYVTLTLNKHLIYRTNYFAETKNPLFNNVVYVPITSENQVIALNVYDYQKVGKDRLFGSYHISASKLFKKDVKSGRFVTRVPDETSLQCTLVNEKGRTVKSYVNISYSVVQTVPVYYPHEIPSVKQLEERIQQKKKEFEEEQEQLKKEMEKNPNDFEIVEVEDKVDSDIRRLNKKDMMSTEDLIQRNSGVCSFQIVDAQLSKAPIYLQLLYDDVPLPAAISQKSHSGKIPPEFGNFFVRDLKHSILTFRTSRKKIVKDVDDIVDETTVSTLEILKKSMEEPTVIGLKNGNSVKCRLLFNPTSSSLAASETVTDTGVLDTTFISAEDVPSHDRNGKSDPMVVVTIDGDRIYQSNPIKKSLNPVWNEQTKIPIPSRSRNKVSVQVLDWDRVGANDLLCESSWDVNSMTPNQEKTFALKLSPHGTIHFKSTFIPRYNKPAIEVGEGSLANLPLKTVGNVANFGVGAVSGAAHVGAGVTGAGLGVVTGGLSKGGKLLKGLGVKKSRNSSEGRGSPEDGTSSKSSVSNFGFDPSVPDTSYVPVRAQTAPTASAKEVSSIQGPPGAIHKRTASSASNHSKNTLSGTHNGKVTVLATENLGKTVQVRVSLAQGGRIKHLYRTQERKANKEGTCHFNETLDFKAPVEANMVFGAVVHHKFSKDTELGVAQISLNDPQLQQDGQIALKLNNGVILFRIQYPEDIVPPTPEIPDEYK